MKAPSTGTSWHVVRCLTGSGAVAGFAAMLYAAAFAPDLLPWYLRQHALGVATVLAVTAVVCHLQLLLAVRSAAGVERATTATVTTALRWAGGGIAVYTAVMVYMFWTGGAMPVRFHELLIGGPISVVIAGTVVAYGLSGAVRVLRTPLNRLPDPHRVTVARRRLASLSRGSGLLALVLLGLVGYLDVRGPDLVPQFFHQYMVGLGTMPLVLALISHEESRGADVDRARRYLRVGGVASGTLLAVQWVTAGAVPPRWHEFVLSVSTSLVVAGFVLRYGVYQMSRMVAALREMQRRIAEHTTRSER